MINMIVLDYKSNVRIASWHSLEGNFTHLVS